MESSFYLPIFLIAGGNYLLDNIFPLRADLPLVVGKSFVS
jgi:hypothetical protein